ncbi:MAG: cytochrome C biogenesis protein [Anaerolineaceae bacterium]|nr:cytochrome C biogenesis protein [Anaerolineaceae bacterium]
MNRSDIQNYKIEVYLPEEALEAIQTALNKAGAGFVGNYDHVFAITQVTGNWRPLAGSSPYQGTLGKMESAPELKMEIDCRSEFVSQAILAIRTNHPYEEPLIRVIPILNEWFD